MVQSTEPINNDESVIMIIYKNPLANGNKHIRIEMNMSKYVFHKMLVDANYDTHSFLTFKDMYDKIWSIPINNVGEIEVY